MSEIRVERIKRIDLQDFGEVGLFPGDVNGDGKLELVFPQGVDAPDRRASTGGYPHEKTMHCVTAIDLDGNILWQTGTPMGDTPRKYHGSGPCLVQDFDGDGKAEVVYVTEKDSRLYIRLLRGEDGSQVAEQETGASYRIIPANLRGLDSKRDFVINDALTLHFAYSEDLTPLWEWKYIYGGGHGPAACDIEGNGRDDLFIGACRLDAEGNRIWWRPDLDDAMEEMGRCPHIDGVQVHRLHHDSDDYQTLWAGGKDAICLNASDGEVRWRLAGEHLQGATVGRFDAGCPDPVIYIFEKMLNKPSYLVSADGEVLWKKDLGGSAGGAAVKGVGPDGSDLLLLSPPVIGQKPYLMNHLGEKVAEFPLPSPTDLPTVAQQRAGSGWGGDTGTGLKRTALDVDGDGCDEVLFYSRQEVLIFKVSS